MVCYAVITKYLLVSAVALLLLTDLELSRFECLTSFTLDVWMITSLDTKRGASKPTDSQWNESNRSYFKGLEQL